MTGFIVKEKKPLRVVTMAPTEATDKRKKSKKEDGGKWLGRNLDNYKKQHRARAEALGEKILKAFLAADTLTAAKKILKGQKA